MAEQSRDAYLKALPPATQYNKRVARYRMKGFHEDPKEGNDLDTVATYPILPPWGPGIPKWADFIAAAGNVDHVYTVPDGKLVQLTTLSRTIVTDATVATRRALVTITRAGAVIFHADAAATQAASLTYYYIAGRTTPNAAVAYFTAATYLPTGLLRAGDIVTLSITGGVAGDSHTANIGLIEYDDPGVQ